MATIWTNDDGLRVRFGTLDSEPAPGVVNGGGVEQELRYEIVGTDLSTAPIDRDIMHGAVLPSGAVITEAQLYVTTGFTSGGAATLTIGTYKVSDDTALDADGIDATIALAAIADTGEKVVCDGAQIAAAGISADAALAADCYVAAIYATAAYTAGQGTLVLKYVTAN